MNRVTFREVQHRSEKRVRCEGCGKRLIRRKTFWQTINPWNKTADGSPKGIPEIRVELADEAKRWQGRPETCTACVDERYAALGRTETETGNG